MVKNVCPPCCSDQFTSIAASSFTDATIAGGTTYVYAVTASDVAGNRSGQSAAGTRREACPLTCVVVETWGVALERLASRNDMGAPSAGSYGAGSLCPE
jgi:hypothetical protein